MKKYILVILILFAAVAPLFMFKGSYFSLRRNLQVETQYTCGLELVECRKNLLGFLKSRQDDLAFKEAEKILAVEPNDLCASWARAEVLRRNYKFEESEGILRQVLSKSPGYIPALITLSYIKYRDNNFYTAANILKQVLRCARPEKEDVALAYMLMGSINARKSSRGGLFGKLAYGTRIRGYFEKAKSIAPELAEVRLGLGTFYLLAPAIAGGNLDKAIEELEYAVEIAPAFATANARLAQAYKKKGNLEKYNFYINRAKELDPENEVVKENEKSGG